MRTVVFLCASLTGCWTTAPRPKVVSVFAASSLTEAFGELELEFEHNNPGVDVQLMFAGSQVLRMQVEHGAPADVIASASLRHLSVLREAELIRSIEPFATSQMALIVPAANPARIREFSDLVTAQRVVLATSTVPAGMYSERLLSRAASQYGSSFASTILEHVVSRESNVRLVRAKVEMGEADAALVYSTDVRAGQKVKRVEIPTELNVPVEYGVATVSGSSQAELARRFVDLLHSNSGQKVLVEHGFSLVSR